MVQAAALEAEAKTICPRIHNKQALTLDVNIEEHEVFMKYIEGLQDYIRKKLHIFRVYSSATIKAIAIEDKYRKPEKKEEKIKD